MMLFSEFAATLAAMLEMPTSDDWIPREILIESADLS
jgi:hypothetical protein